MIKTKKTYITSRKKINNAKKARGYSIIEMEVKETKSERKKNERKQTKRNTIEGLRH